jgi:hypothetical protein
MKILGYKNVSTLLLSLAFAITAYAENITLTAQKDVNDAKSDIVTLGEGDTATLVYSNVTDGAAFVTYVKQSFYWSNRLTTTTNPRIVITGPATIQFSLEITPSGSPKGLATFEINRAGIASPPAAIPQEAGTTWNVILESSSDLINWTPANPGNYSGTEPKRFFRTRMVKNP